MNPIPSRAAVLAFFVLAALPLQPLTAQQATPQDWRFDASLLVRIPSMPDVQLAPTLEELLATVSLRSSLRNAVRECASHAGIHACDLTQQQVTVVLQGSQAIVRLTFTGTADTTPELQPAAAEALAVVLRKPLEHLLLEPHSESIFRDLEDADQRAAIADKRLRAAEAELQELGLDDFAALQATLFDLRRQATELDLDLRTEQAVSEYLNQQYAQAMDRAVQGDAKELSGGAAPSPLLRHKHEQVELLQTQVTQSALALQRHIIRKRILGETLDDLQRQALAAAERSHRRIQALRERDAALVEVSAAQQLRAQLRRDRAATMAIQVQPWN